MSNKKIKTQKTNQNQELDAVYLMKIVLFFLLGCIWINIGTEPGIPIPVGLLLGIVFASHDHFQIDKKVEFVVLFMAAVLSFIAPIGFVLNVG
jgi:hypothetical protein